ncbi:PGF-CTERM-anchored ABC transporter substrate-binding protein [Halobellus ordinarius]|uniref:PGF-CTERM-anchored ABC transporter substrate-binding protein n=1 Tax=Halobellus ordinarius TaxID=3075120 RepID=UPI0028800E9D|nr:PGF-CTERM-anchored ABC transporter substrate-binding protein [Halobellus sp. ZY16]
MHRSVLVVATLLVFAAVVPGVGAAAITDEPAADAAGSGAVDAVADGGASPPADHDSETCEFPYETTDATGADVEIPSDPERIVTLNPSAAQTMWEIGAQDEVVGVSQYASYLDGADEKVNVSGAGGPSVEKVLGTNPDLILVPNSSYGAAADRVEQLRAQGIPVYVFGQPTSLEFVADKTERIGRLTGNCEAGTERAAEIRQSVNHMEEALEGTERPVGLNVFYGYTSGDDTFIGDLMETAGLRNGAAEAGISGFQVINDETVVEMNPGWIVVPEGSPVPENAAYNSTTAVQEGNIVRVDTNYLQQPAPRSVQSAEVIMRRVHPEAYEEYRALESGEPTASPTDDGTPPETVTPGTSLTTSTPTSTGTPGFGIVVAVIALAAAALLAGRR